MKIEVGKRYVRRDGTVTPPLEKAKTEYGVSFDVEDWGVFIDGYRGLVRYRLGECKVAYYILGCEDEHPFDLVAEFRPSQNDTEEPFLTEGYKVSEKRYSIEELQAAYPPPKEEDIDSVLEARGANYGDFYGHADITQGLKTLMRYAPKWSELNAAQKESLEMIVHKIGRILNGNVAYVDSWTDIVGYAKLGEIETKKLGGE